MQKLTIIVCLCLMCLTLKAAKANPEPMTFIQSDGTEITVRLYGDEHFSWYATMDGILLMRNGDDFFVADVDEDGCLKATKCRAHDAGQRTAQERNMMKAQRRDIFFSEKADRRRAALRRVPVDTSTDPPYFPHEGSPTAIVILVNFADTTFTLNDPVKSFDQYLNGDKQQNLGHYENSNYGSVRRYFEDMSFGQFSPQFKVFGPVTVSKGMAYYGKNGDKDKDVRYREMLTEAVDSVEKYCLIDFDDPVYDSNNDGNIDLVYFIYAGFGESNGAPSETLWPKSGTLNGGNIITLDNGKTISRFGISNELYGRSYKSLKDEDKFVKRIDGIGLFCHEFSHTLGLPDFYPNNLEAQSVSNQEMEMWSLMDGGEYLGRGYRPAAYTAWEREAMGWFEIETLSENQRVDLKPIDDNGKAYRIVNPADESEYMMVENIQLKGWSQKALGHGLLVYHVQWPAKTVNLTDRPNNTKDYPRMAVVPADGLLFSSYLVNKAQAPWGTLTIYEMDEDGNYVYDENGDAIIVKDHVVQNSDYEAHHAGDSFPGKSDVGELGWNLQLPNFTWYTPAKPEDATNEKYTSTKKYPVYQTLKDITEDTNTGVVSFDFYTDYTTGIDMTSLIKDEERIISNSTTVYDLQGRKVSSPSGGGREGASSLISHPSSKKGIYIVGGKKIVVR